MVQKKSFLVQLKPKWTENSTLFRIIFVDIIYIIYLYDLNWMLRNFGRGLSNWCEREPTILKSRILAAKKRNERTLHVIRGHKIRLEELFRLWCSNDTIEKPKGLVNFHPLAGTLATPTQPLNLTASWFTFLKVPPNKINSSLKLTVRNHVFGGEKCYENNSQQIEGMEASNLCWNANKNMQKRVKLFVNFE